MPNRNPINRLIESGVVLKCPHKSVNASIMNMLEQNTFLYQIVALERRIKKRVERIRTQNEFARRGELSSGQIESFQGFPQNPPTHHSKTDKTFFLLRWSSSFIDSAPISRLPFYLSIFKIPKTTLNLWFERLFLSLKPETRRFTKESQNRESLSVEIEFEWLVATLTCDFELGLPALHFSSCLNCAMWHFTTITVMFCTLVNLSRFNPSISH